MRFDREPWVKLYRAESPQHRLMSAEARMFRDFLLRYAEEDGTLLHESRDVAKDLCRVVAFEASAVRRVATWLRELEKVGYVQATKGGHLKVVRFAEAQAARTKNAERQARFKAKQKAGVGNGDTGDADNVTDNTDGNAPGNASADALGTLQREEKRERRDEIPQTPKRGLDSDDIRERCRAALRDPFGARHSEPHKWPEVVEAAEILFEGLSQTGAPRLGQMSGDTGTRRIIELFDAGFTLGDLRTASPKLLGHKFLNDVRKIHAVTPAILREILGGAGAGGQETVVVSP